MATRKKKPGVRYRESAAHLRMALLEGRVDKLSKPHCVLAADLSDVNQQSPMIYDVAKCLADHSRRINALEGRQNLTAFWTPEPRPSWWRRLGRWWASPQSIDDRM